MNNVSTAAKNTHRCKKNSICFMIMLFLTCKLPLRRIWLWMPSRMRKTVRSAGYCAVLLSYNHIICIYIYTNLYSLYMPQKRCSSNLSWKAKKVVEDWRCGASYWELFKKNTSFLDDAGSTLGHTSSRSSMIRMWRPLFRAPALPTSFFCPVTTGCCNTNLALVAGQAFPHESEVKNQRTMVKRLNRKTIESSSV